MTRSTPWAAAGRVARPATTGAGGAAHTLPQGATNDAGAATRRQRKRAQEAAKARRDTEGTPAGAIAAPASILVGARATAAADVCPRFTRTEHHKRVGKNGRPLTQ